MAIGMMTDLARSRVDSLTRRSNARLVPCGSVNAGLTDRARNARLPRPFFERSTSFPRTGVRSTLRPTYGLAQRAHTMIAWPLDKNAQLYRIINALSALKVRRISLGDWG